MRTDITDTPDIVSTDIIVQSYRTETKGSIGLHDIERRPILVAVKEERPATQTIGDRLKAYRRSRGIGGKDLTQQALAKELGISQSQVSDWERGRYGTTKVSTLLTVATRLRVNVSDLVAGMDAAYDSMDSDLVRHGVRGKRSPSQKVGENAPPEDDPRLLTARIAELENDLAAARGFIDQIGHITQKARPGRPDRKTAGAAPKHRGSNRSSS